MIAALLLSVLPHPASPLPLAWPCFQEAADAEVDAKIAEAGTDVAKLLELAQAFAAAGKDDAAKKTYKKIVELDPMHADAHKALRHHLYEGKYFESYAELSKYRREETAKMKEKGLARWKDQWVPEADVPYLNMGWTKDDKGKWLNPVEVARAKQIAEWQAAGCSYRKDDSSWIAPADMEKWKQLLWKCGEEWVDMAKANEFHAQIGRWWEIEGEHFSVWSTCEWDVANTAAWEADQIYADMVRLFGVHPPRKPHFIVLNSRDQFNKLASGDQALQLPQAESEGFSTLHGAYFADILFDPSTQPPQFAGCGVSYWDRKDPKDAPWGPFWARFAAAQSFVDAIDPSWLAVSEIIASISGGAQPNPGAFWTEKKIPRWLRYGAASYAERFLKKPPSDGGNPWELREFFFEELKKGGNLHKLEDIFAFALSLDDQDGSTRLYHEAGMVVSFLLDGSDGDKKLREKHAALKAALANKAGKPSDVAEAVEGLQKELLKNEKDIKKFAGL